MIAQLPALVHLQPPGGATPVHLERFSPLLNDPSLGMPATQVGRPYPLMYDAEKVDLWRLAYFFETGEVGASLAMGRRLARAIDTWQVGFAQSHLEWFSYGDELVVVDDRVGWPQHEYVLRGTDAQLYRSLGQHLGLTTAARTVDLPVEQTKDICDSFVADGLCYTDGGRYVALALDAPAVARKATT
jgi:hypothetical protein